MSWNIVSISIEDLMNVLQETNGSVEVPAILVWYLTGKTLMNRFGLPKLGGRPGYQEISLGYIFCSMFASLTEPYIL